MQVCELRHQKKLEEWREEIIACRSSGMRVAEWCKQQGYTKTTYYRWEREIFQKRQLAPIEKEMKAPVLVELPTIPTVQTGVKFQTTAIIHCGGIEVELSNNVSPDLLELVKEMILRC